MNNEQMLKMINKRIDELAASYKFLNDSHQKLQDGFIEMSTEWKTTKSWVKYILGASLLGTLVNLATVARIFGVI